MVISITSWQLNEEPQDGAYVRIVGRVTGLSAWILAKMGVTSIATFTVTADKVCYESGTWKGQTKVVVPLRCITRFYCGYEKPWPIVLAIGLLFVSHIYTSCSSFTSVIATMITMPIWIFILIGVLVYYLLTRYNYIGFGETSGWHGTVSFKNVMMDGRTIDDNEVRRVIDIVQKLVDKRRSNGEVF